jgi:hypothetical protein
VSALRTTIASLLYSATLRLMEIAPASQDSWPALAELFAAGGDPRWCWCQAGCRDIPVVVPVPRSAITRIPDMTRLLRFRGLPIRAVGVDPSALDR